MEQWEYNLRILYADLDHEGVRAYLQEKYKGWTPSKYSPEALEKYLNTMGKEGWEVIHLEPIYGSGRNSDILFIGGHVPDYGHAYFCVLKRRLT